MECRRSVNNSPKFGRYLVATPKSSKFARVGNTLSTGFPHKGFTPLAGVVAVPQWTISVVDCVAVFLQSCGSCA